jgi:hypothetical protein
VDQQVAVLPVFGEDALIHSRELTEAMEFLRVEISRFHVESCLSILGIARIVLTVAIAVIGDVRAFFPITAFFSTCDF